ncbi:MAG: DUF1269 domain-containing protein [Anaerolineae bacterium]|nr:DUF1269 domain-containing protein [Anaerolineae bacterium]
MEKPVGPIELVVAAFPGEEQAEDVLKMLRAYEKEGVLLLVNAAVMVKKVNGKVSMKETQDVSGKQGALFGAISGALIGLIGGPADAIVGAIAGAATGGVAAHAIDMGFDDAMLEELQRNLKPGSSAILALVQHQWVDRLLAELDNLGAALFRQALKAELVAQLAAQEDAPEADSQESD